MCRFHAHREPQAFGSKQDHVELACFGWLHLNPPDGYLHSKGGLTESVRLASASTGSLSRWLSTRWMWRCATRPTCVKLPIAV